MAENEANTLKPTEAELEILQVLWQHGPSTVRFVNGELNKTRDTGYTTTLKIMQIMYEKGMVQRDESGRSHIYKPAVAEEKTQQQLLDRFLDSTFRGSAHKLVLQALGSHQTSAEELEEIKALINKLEGGKK